MHRERAETNMNLENPYFVREQTVLLLFSTYFQVFLRRKIYEIFSSLVPTPHSNHNS